MAKTLKIWCYDTESDTIYQLYTGSVDGEYMTSDRIVDAVSYPENGIDNLYFTDNFNEVRRIKCEIPSPYTVNFLSDQDLSLQRRGANGTVTLSSIASGGSLLSGTYQYAYRMVDPDNNVYTKWSTLSNPIHVYSKETGETYTSGYGVYTNRKITLTITPSVAEAEFAYYQLAVVENIYPTGEASALSASLLPIQTITPGSTASFQHKSNDKIGIISIEELVVDMAAIETAKTIAINNSRLFLGNISYRNLDILANTPSNNPPSVTGSIVVNAMGTAFSVGSQEDTASRYKGYFRDEVYRFGVVYYDKYGNKSAPYVLDMTSITGNTISGATDMKFPNRHDRTSVNTSVLDASGAAQSLGLSLTLSNHPSWATGFEIVRQKRIKRILFQSPCIPMVSVKGVGAFENYPSSAVVPGPTVQAYPSAQPQTSDSVYVPKNLLWPEARSIVKNTTTSGTNAAGRKLGESRLDREQNITMVIVFPDGSMYEAKEYTFGGYEQIESVDYVLAKANLITYQSVTTPGDDQDTDVSVTFYGLHDDFYFYDYSASKAKLTDTYKITDTVYVDNYSSGNTLEGNKILSHSDLQTTGLTLGRTPNNQRMLVCKLDQSITDEGAESRTFVGGVHNAYSAGGYIVGGSGPVYIGTANYTNDYVISQGAFTADSTPVQVIRIVNVTNPNIGDTRYGEADSNREFISTGTKYSFSSGQLTTVQNKASLPVTVTVYGGDCFVTHHTFKVADSAYSVVNQTKHTTGYQSESSLIDKWGAIFRIETGSPDATLTMPVAVKGAAQYVQVYLESEYNGQVRDADVVGPTTTSNGLTYIYNTLGGTSGSANARTSLSYGINKNISRENDEKVYVPLPDFFDVKYDFNSRIHYSDIKIYNSTESGFDTFRVSNFYDLQESGGPLTKLAIAGDNLYAIQAKRISYLPVGRRQIETTDAGVMSVGSSDVLSDARIIEPSRGSQHLAGIVQTGGLIIMPDNYNKAIYSLAGQELAIISDMGMASYFRNKFGTVFEERVIGSVYDPVRKEYWIYGTDFCYVFNFGLQSWTSNYEFSNLAGGKYTNQKLYLVSQNSDVSVHSMYTGDYNSLMGTEVTPRVSFVVNPDFDYSKTFDDIAVSASQRLSNIDMEVEREDSLGNQTVSEVNLDVLPVEGSYRIKSLRDPRGERLRGTYMNSTIKWTKNNIVSVLRAVYTKYRLSSRNPF